MAGVLAYASLLAAASSACAVSGCDATVIVARRIVPDASGAIDADAAMEAGVDASVLTDAGNGGDAGAFADGTVGADAGANADAAMASDADASEEGSVVGDAGVDADARPDAGFCLPTNGDAGAVPDPDSSVLAPWSTGFENGFCDFTQPLGFCFQTGPGSYSLVTSPVHSGQFAAAFSVRSDVDGGSQVRCVEQGLFPAAAYYGAWYYLPASANNNGNWNLLHYQGGVPGQALHGLWDLSLVNSGDGGLRVTLFDFLGGVPPDAGTAPPLPIGQWVHLEVYFKRAKDATGEVSIFQNGVLAVRYANAITDDTDWGQWYVGNLANALTPSLSTVYVDDVTIAFSP